MTPVLRPEPRAVTLPAPLVGQLLGHLADKPRLVWSRRLGLHAALPPALVLDLGRHLRGELASIEAAPAPAPMAAPAPVAPVAPVAEAAEPPADPAPADDQDFSSGVTGIFGQARGGAGAAVVDVAKDALRQAYPAELGTVPAFMARGLLVAVDRRLLVRDADAVGRLLAARSVAGWAALVSGTKSSRQREREFRDALVPTAEVAPPLPAAPVPSLAPRSSAPRALIRLDPRAPSEMEKRVTRSASKPAFVSPAERHAERVQAAIRHLQAAGFAVVSTKSGPSSLPGWTVSGYSGLFLGSHLLDLAGRHGFDADAAR